MIDKFLGNVRLHLAVGNIHIDPERVTRHHDRFSGRGEAQLDVDRRGLLNRDGDVANRRRRKTARRGGGDTVNACGNLLKAKFTLAIALNGSAKTDGNTSHRNADARNDSSSRVGDFAFNVSGRPLPENRRCKTKYDRHSH